MQPRRPIRACIPAGNDKADPRGSAFKLMAGARLQPINFFFEPQLLLFHPPDLLVIGPGSCHLLGDPAIELPVLL